MSTWEALLGAVILLILMVVIPGGVIYLIEHGRPHAANRFCTRLCKERNAS